MTRRTQRFKWPGRVTLALGVLLLSSAALSRFGWTYVKAGPMSVMIAESELRLSVFDPRVAAPTFLPQDWISSQVVSWPLGPAAAWRQQPPGLLLRRHDAPREYIDLRLQGKPTFGSGPGWDIAFEYPSPGSRRHWLTTTRTKRTGAWLGTQFTLNLWTLSVLALALGMLPWVIRRGTHDCVPGMCLGCGYDCRSLPTAAVCPECGEAIAKSIDSA